MAVLRYRSNQTEQSDKFLVASQWKLISWKFFRHKVAVASLLVLAMFYCVAIFCEFFSPASPHQRDSDHIYTPPQRIHMFGPDGFTLRPFVYGIKGGELDANWKRQYEPDENQILKIRFFVKGAPYKLFGLIPWDRHFVGIDQQDEPFYLLGSDHFGRDLLSRIIYGARASLSIGLAGVMLTMVIGCVIGGISGYFGGLTDTVIQRIIETLMSLPTLPLWMGLSASLPMTWSPLHIYLGMVVILSLIGWTGLARVVRGKIISLREEDFAMAARIAGATEMRILRKHLLPSFFSYLIVNVTLAVPGMILGETALSYLGLGLRAPVISWGVLLQLAQSVQAITDYPWIMWPGAFVMVVVLAFNFVGDGLRDAADPYAR